MDFATKTVEEVTETLIDYRGKTPPKSDAGVRLITAKVIKGGFITDDKPEFILDEFYDTWMRRGLPKQGDILITTEAPLGEVAQLRTSERVALAQRVILLRGDPDVIDQRYYFQCLKSDVVQGGLKQRATGTTVLGIKQSELRKVLIPWYPLPIQRRIADILSAYDDLIENNRRRIQILEEMARNLYREWFVKFRFPLYRSDGTIERIHNPETDPMVDSELGPIPKGWEVRQFGDVATVNGTSIRKQDAPAFINYIDIKSVSTGRINTITRMTFAEAPGRARRHVSHGDTIWSTVRPNRRSYSVVLNPLQDTIVSTGFAVLSPKVLPYSLLYYTVTTDDFADYLTNRARGAAYPAVNTEDFTEAVVQVPSTELVKAFHAQAEPCMLLSHELKVKSDVLRRTRDLLLPRLVSGQLDVSEFDEQLQEVS